MNNTLNIPVNTYHGFYNGKKIEFSALTSYAAQQEAIRQFGVKKNKSHMVSVVLVAKGENPVVHVAVD